MLLANTKLSAKVKFSILRLVNANQFWKTKTKQKNETGTTAPSHNQHCSLLKWNKPLYVVMYLTGSRRQPWQPFLLVFVFLCYFDLHFYFFPRSHPFLSVVSKPCRRFWPGRQKYNLSDRLAFAITLFNITPVVRFWVSIFLIVTV